MSAKSSQKSIQGGIEPISWYFIEVKPMEYFVEYQEIFSQEIAVS